MRSQHRLTPLVAAARGRLEQFFVMRWMRRLLTRGGIGVAFTLSAQAFVSLIPVMIVAAALNPVGQGRSFRDTLLRVLGLRGASDAILHALVAGGGQTRSEITWVGAVYLLVSALSFTRALQQTYELGWELPRKGLRGSGHGLLWLGSLIAYLGLLAEIKAALPGGAAGAGLKTSLAVAASFGFWLWTAYMLLGGRIGWRRLVPGAALTALGLVALAEASVLYMPQSIASNVNRYGPIGAVFAIITWLLIMAYIVLAGATLGAALEESRTPARRGARARRRGESGRSRDNSNLVAVAYPDEFRAAQVIETLKRLQMEHLIDLDDAVYVTRGADGKPRLHQIQNLVGARALGGAFWGVLFGLIVLLPVVGATRGAVAGGVSGALSDLGVHDDFAADLAACLQTNSSAVIVLVRQATPDKVLAEVRTFGGTVLRTSLSDADEAKLRAALIMHETAV
jgi:uncharacterized membrane protein/uncharacterized BrkB/YihY/UPF0761 family membrane protein